MRRVLSSWVSNGEKKALAGLVGLPGVLLPRDFVDLAITEINQARCCLHDGFAAGPGTAKALLHRLDSVSDSLCKVADVGELVRCLHPVADWVDSGNKVVQLVGAALSEFNVDRALWEALKYCTVESDLSCLNPEERNVLESMRESMEQQGMHLEEPGRSELLALLQREGELSFEMMTRSDDDSVQDSAKHRKLVEFIDTRQKLARMRGFDDWNSFSQRENILKTPETVKNFLSETLEALRKPATAELELLSSSMMRRDENNNSPLQAWEVELSMSRYHKKHLGYLSEFRPFLSLHGLLQGMRVLFDALFGIAVRLEDPNEGEVWCDEVMKFVLYDSGMNKQNCRLAVLYVDAWDRPGKTMASVQFTLRCSKSLSDDGEKERENEIRQTPATALALRLSSSSSHLNFSRFASSTRHQLVDRARATVLTISEARNLFHELGHAAHSLLSRTKLQHLSGTRGSIDFVEIPSHLFEYFIKDGFCLLRLLKDFQGNPPSLSLIRSYEQHKNTFGHIEALQQVLYAAIDQAVFSCKKTDENNDENRLQEYVAEYLATEYPLLSFASSSNFLPFVAYLNPPSLTSFDHLVHYGGSYYAYLYCRVASAFFWYNGMADDPLERPNGLRLRQVLSKGSVESSLMAWADLFVNPDEKILDQLQKGTVSLQPYLDEIRNTKNII